MRRLGLPLLLIVLGGCTDTLAVRQAQLNAFVGRSELELVQAMGVPTQTFETGGVRFLSYQQSQTQVIPASPWYWGGPFPGFYGGFPPQLVTWSCDTTFTVVDKRVTGFTMRGNGC
ncbi:hypothetical protein [Rhodopila sp.]|jgi:hypothetical protein|uniref:hypothetical protein n=1 Tax=Rhodopila sp. TaxID=2480087 RepID=UPI002CD53AA2|nr:hypothetical protein [Rhodopila sp.]HVZ06529.1 hypothetical protein [Rhodopila sp.]